MSLRLQRAETISTVVIIGFFFAVCFHYVLHFYFGRPYPYATFLFDPVPHQSDYRVVVSSAESLDPYRYDGGSVGNYFPFTYVCALVFGAFRRLGLYLFMLLSLGGIVAYFYRQSGIRADAQINSLGKIRLTFTLVVMSYPILFELDRANFESLTFLLIAAGAFLIGERRFRLSIIPLALAIAMKGYPLVFLALYLPGRRYREIGQSIALSVGVCLAVMSLLHGGVLQNVRGFASGLRLFQDSYVVHGAGGMGVRLNSSLFAPLGLLNSNPVFIRHALTYYNVFALLSGGAIAWLLATRRVERWKAEYLLVAAALVLPFLSYDYKLLLLFIPLASFLNSARRDEADAFYCASFGAMLIPKNYVILGGHAGIVNDVTISSLLEPLILLATVAVIVREALAHRESGETVREEGNNTDNDDSRTFRRDPVLP